ncbi:MAG: amidohydrolase family protein [Balneolaceae bacterium]
MNSITISRIIPDRIVLLLPILLLLSIFTSCTDRETAGSADSETPAFEEIWKIDVHSHIFDEIPYLAELMEQTNSTVINLSNRGADGHLERMHEIGESLANRWPQQFAWGSAFDLTRRDEPEYAEEVKQALDETFASGALLVKIWKEIGMELQTPDGEFLMADDPLFDPVYSHMAEQRIPLIAHLADPIDAWRPLDPESVHYGYYSNNPEWHVYGNDDYPSHEEIMQARDNILEKHPNLILIGAHNGSMSHDLDMIAERLDRYPNFYIEVSARTRDLTRHPSDKVREFFINYSDRILYGIDVTWKPFLSGPRTDEQQRAFADRYIDRFRLDYSYYAGSGTITYSGREVESLHLPREVLENFYFRNALRLMPDLAR